MDMGLIVQSGILLVAIGALAYTSNVDKNNKITRIYARIDTIKKEFEEKHVSKDVCKIINNQYSADISEIKTDVKILLRMSGTKRGKQ